MTRKTVSARPTIPLRAAEPDGLTRREALQVMAASLALASAGCTRAPVERLYPYVNMPEAGRGNLPAYYASAHVRNGYALGVLVGTREGRPIKIEGNPTHPSSLGSTDVFAQASVLELWDPDRSQVVHQQLPRAPTGSASHSPIARGDPLTATSTWVAFDDAWRQRAAGLAPRGGRGLAILTEAFTSPTLGLQLRALLKRFPEARWYRHAPLEATASRQGAELAFGRACDWLLRFDRARFVVALDADPFSQGPGQIRHAHDWAARRPGIGDRDRDAGSASGAPRSVAVETSPGLFGARADERIALAPAAIEALVEELDGLLGDPGRGSAAASPLAQRLAARLRAVGAQGLLIAGPHLSPAACARVATIHQRLGAIGRTIVPIDPPDRLDGLEPGSLASLADSVRAGRVETLLVVGGNPAYDSPGSIDFADALGRVPFSAHLGLHRNETARLATWHLPASHDYESWADARGHDGSSTIIQPAILPLYDTRSTIEWLAGLAGGDVRDGHELVRSTWRSQQGAGLTADGSEDPRFAAWWRKTLGAGMVEGSAAAPLELDTARPVGAEPTLQERSSVVAVFAADASVDGGRYANNGWLQELPRSLTKLTWGNAVLLGPRTAVSLGVKTGDVVQVRAGDRSIEGPVWVLAEHAEGAATLPLGYGRRAAGRVGDGVGFDAYPLRPVDAATLAVEIVPTGRQHRFAVTQHRIDQLGRDLARSVVAGAALPRAEPKPSLYPPIAYPDHAWAMAIDLDACIGCNACTIACQAENNIPVVGYEEVINGREMHWIRVDRYQASADRADATGDAVALGAFGTKPGEVPGNLAGSGSAKTAAKTASDSAGDSSIFQPVPCMHCEEAPCEVVCPVGATVHDTEGLNVQVYNRCVGTRFCSDNCPYKVRRFNFLQYADDTTETLKAMRNPEVTVRQRGVMEKCTYCVQRLSQARIESQKAACRSGTATWSPPASRSARRAPSTSAI